MGIIDERRRDRIAESLREEYIRCRRMDHPQFFLNRQTYGDAFWSKVADKLISKLGTDFDVKGYIKVLFAKYGSAAHAPPMNMVGSDKVVALFQSGAVDEQAEAACIKHLLNMEKLYLSYRRFRSVADILSDQTLYLNSLFRFVKANEEKAFVVASKYEAEALEYLNAYPIYKKVLGNRLPETLRCS